RFSITASFISSISPAIGYCLMTSILTPYATRATYLRDQRGQAARRPSRWLLHATNRRIGKDRTGPDLDEHSLSFSMAPNQAIPTEKSIRFSSLAAVGPETILSRPEALNASGSPELSNAGPSTLPDDWSE